MRRKGGNMKKILIFLFCFVLSGVLGIHADQLVKGKSILHNEDGVLFGIFLKEEDLGGLYILNDKGFIVRINVNLFNQTVIGLDADSFVYTKNHCMGTPYIKTDDWDINYSKKNVFVRKSNNVLDDEEYYLFKTDKKGKNRTPLHEASGSGHTEIAKLLISKGAKINVKNKREFTPLHWASGGGHIEIAKLLISKGAKINVKDKDGITPLHLASYEGHTEIARLLISKGAKINAKDEYGWTPLHSAANKCHFAMVKLLIRKRARINIETEKGYRPLDLAQKQLLEKEECGPVIRLLQN